MVKTIVIVGEVEIVAESMYKKVTVKIVFYSPPIQLHNCPEDFTVHQVARVLRCSPSAMIWRLSSLC